MSNPYQIIDERFRAMVLPNARLETLGDGFAWLEGPVWFADHQCLYVSDLPDNRILRWSEDGGIAVFRQKSGFTNGNARDALGRLITCSHHQRRIERTEFDGTITVLASHYQGKQLNSPNDLVCRSDGTIWFTDPPYGIQKDYEGGRQKQELPPMLYRLEPATGALSVVADDFAGPNGLAFSPDERMLYVSETGEEFDPLADRHIRRLSLDEDGHVHGSSRFQAVTPGHADGLKVDEQGNVWTAAGDGVHCLSSEGELLGKIATGCTVSNLCFGGRHNSRLFLCASHSLMAVYTNVRGCVR